MKNSLTITNQVNLILLLSSIAAIFFLYTAGVHIAGGGSHFFDWAIHLAGSQQVFNWSDISQRDIGYSLFLILSGFPYTNSILFTIVLQCMMAISIPLAIYYSLYTISPNIAFITSLFGILTLSPYVLMKFIYHDSLYIYLMFMTLLSLLNFIQGNNKNVSILFFTIFIIASSFSRSAGNYIYPLIILVLYLIDRKYWKAYIGSLLVFAIALAGYMDYREQLFKGKGNENGVGLQLFYAAYIPLGLQKIPLASSMGPATAKMIDDLDEYLGPEVRKSRMMENYSAPEEFINKNIISKTPKQLKHSLINEPCEEYMWILYGVYPNKDLIYKDIAIEIIKAHPFVMVKHVMTNIYSMLFNPGMNFGRYDLSGQRGTSGVDFLPGIPTKSEGGPGMQDVRPYGDRLVKEVDFRPLEHFGNRVNTIFGFIKEYYINKYRLGVMLTNIGLVIVWIFLAHTIYMKIKKYILPPTWNTAFKSAIVIFAFLFYEVMITGIFAGAHMRYFHFTELYRILLLGVAIFYINIIIRCRLNKSVNESVNESVVESKRNALSGSLTMKELANDRNPVITTYAIITMDIILIFCWLNYSICKNWLPSQCLLS